MSAAYRPHAQPVVSQRVTIGRLSPRYMRPFTPQKAASGRAGACLRAAGWGDVSAAMQPSCICEALFLQAENEKTTDNMDKKTLFTGALCVLLTAACHGGHSHDEAAAAHEDEAHAHAGEIVISQEKAKASGIAVETVQAGTFSGVIPCGGKILAASGQEATVVATVPGVVRLTRGMAEGSAVAKGATLFTVSSDKLQDDPARQAAIAYHKAKDEYERAARLVKDRIVTRKDFNALKSAYESAKTAYEAYGPQAKAGGVAVKSPIGGYVKACLVKEGDYVSVGQPMMTVTQTRNLYLKANVPERYYAQLGSLSSAKFKTAYGDRVYDLRQLDGRLVAAGKQTADGSPYVPVTFQFSNRADVAPGAFVETYLLTAPRQGVVSVPVSALTDEQGVNFVYVQTDPTCYEKREVAIGQTDGERVEIKSGLKAGEKIVAKGAMQVKLASASTAIPAHTHNH